MARVVAFVPDLLFGSKVLESIRAAGHEPISAGDPRALAAALPGAGAVIADLTVDPAARTELVRGACPPEVPVLGFYSHVEADARDRARAAGFALVVPRSRMAREGPALIARLVEGAA